jgi:hypothetical protein
MQTQINVNEAPAPQTKKGEKMNRKIRRSFRQAREWGLTGWTPKARHYRAARVARMRAAGRNFHGPTPLVG